MPVSFRLCLIAVLLALTGCPRQQPPPPPGPPPAATAVPPEEFTMDWELTSSAFTHGQRLPAKYTGDGADASPPLAWTAPPEGTQELVLICNDPDAPRGAFTHWLLYGLSPQLTALPEDLPRQATLADPTCLQGTNSAGQTGYFGPTPPPGKPHRYQFTLYALRAQTDLPAGAEKAQILHAIEGKILGKTMLEGLYGR